MSENFPAFEDSVPQEIVPNGEADRKEAEVEIHNEAAAAENELFLDRSILLNTIEAAWKDLREGDQGDPDVREQNPDGTLTPYGVIQRHKDRFLAGWSRILLDGAMESKGNERVERAQALKELRLLVGEDVFDKETRGMNITKELLDGLIVKGKEEGGNGLPYKGY